MFRGSLERIEIARYRDKVAAKATSLVSNEVLMLVNRVLNWAIDEGMIDAKPAARLRRAGKKRPRERVLNHADILKFWSALSAMESMTREHMAPGEKGRMLAPATRSILRLLLLTGQRRGEIVGALKSELELDGDEPVWTIPGALTKNGLLHRLPLCPMAAAEFRKAVEASPAKSKYVFPSPDDPIRSAITPVAVTRSTARLVAELKISTVSPHDLRRTVGTELAAGIARACPFIGAQPQSLSRGITDAVYNRYAYDKEKREALIAWEQRLSTPCSHPFGSQTSLHEAAACARPLRTSKNDRYSGYEIPL